MLEVNRKSVSGQRLAWLKGFLQEYLTYEVTVHVQACNVEVFLLRIFPQAVDCRDAMDSD